MIKEVLSLIKELVELSKNLIENNTKKRIKKEEKTELLKKIILYQRNLKRLKNKKYSAQEFIDNQNTIVDIIKTIFDKEMADVFVEDNVNIYWALRQNADIDSFMIEESLENLISMANKKGYKVQ